jgi:hypothetical protein
LIFALDDAAAFLVFLGEPGSWKRAAVVAGRSSRVGGMPRAGGRRDRAGKRFWGRPRSMRQLVLPPLWGKIFPVYEAIMTPDEELAHLDAQLERLEHEHPRVQGVLRIADNCLRRCSKWKWEQHGWTISDPQACGIMNGNDRERRTALLSVLNGHVQEIEIVSDLDVFEVVPSGSPREPA